MKIPANRVVAFLLPPIQAFGALAAAYIVARLNLLGFAELDQSSVAQLITGGIVASVLSGLAALGNWQWLKGHHIEISQGSWSGDPTDVAGVDGVDLPAPTTHLNPPIA